MLCGTVPPQDVALLPSAKDGARLTANEVCQFPSHSSVTFQHGITQAYAGHSTRDFLNDHAENEFDNPWGSKLSDTSACKVVKQPVTIQEIKQWQSVHEPEKEDLDSEIARQRARKGVRHARHEYFLATAKPAEERKNNDKDKALAKPTQKRMAERKVPLQPVLWCSVPPHLIPQPPISPGKSVGIQFFYGG